MARLYIFSYEYLLPQTLYPLGTSEKFLHSHLRIGLQKDSQSSFLWAYLYSKMILGMQGSMSVA